MRLIVDLSSCQAACDSARVVGFVESMLQSRGDHEVYIAVDACQMVSAESLRKRFRAQLTPAHFLSFVSPESDALAVSESIRAGIAAALKNMALQALLVDAVVEVNPTFESGRMMADESYRRGPLRVCVLTESVATTVDGSMQKCAVDLILAVGEPVRRSAIEALECDEDRLIDIGDQFDASDVWKSIQHALSDPARTMAASPRRIAIVSPIAQAESNDAALRQQLADHVAIDWFVEADAVPGARHAQADGQVFSLADLPARCDSYAAVLYVMANHSGHAFMLPTIEQVPGMLVLQDMDLEAPFAALAAMRHASNLIAREALYGGGLQAIVGDRHPLKPARWLRRLLELCDGVLASADSVAAIAASNRSGAWLPPLAIGLADVLLRAPDRTHAFRQLVDALQGLKLDDAQLDLIARHAATNANWRRQPRLLVDVTQLAISNARSGIQRVVRNIARELGRATDLDRPFELVQLSQGRLYRANGIVASIFDIDAATLAEQEMVIQPGDTLLMLDSSWEQYQDFTPVFQAVRQMGGTIVTVVYDLIPLLMPDLCSPGLTVIFQNWFRLAVEHSDQLVCISNAVADEVRTHLREQGRAHRIDVGHWRLGADIAITRDESTVRPQVQALAGDAGSAMFLMVGTIEPRKGHDFALDAFDRLWQDGSEVRLCIAGSIGWMVNDTVKRIRQHPQLNRKLFFIEQFTDAEIALCYQSAAALIAASIAEGFGLPIVEAAMHGVPVIASDIPVFREVGRERAVYFSRTDPRHLSVAVRDFLMVRRDAREVAQVDVVTWRESARLLLDEIGCRRA